MFGDKTIHIGRQSGPDSAIRHNLCRSTMTESEACQLSKSQEHEIKIHTEDMKTSIDRHRNCGPGQLSSKMDIRLLTLCHTTYTEINETIWRTTTWSFNSLRLFGMWLQMRNATQLMYLSHILFDSFIPSPCVLSLPKCKMITLETLHINAYSGNMKEDLRGSKFLCLVISLLTLTSTQVSEFIPSKAVSVIHYRSNYDFLTWEDSLAIAENIRQQLMAKMEDS